VKTPELGSILPGITRELVIELADSEGFPVRTGRYTPEEVRNADEAFLTNSTWEIRPISTFDGIEIGAGPLTALLQRLYDERIERRCYGANSR
jgi:branched-chain amino acid aminotransferase